MCNLYTFVIHFYPLVKNFINQYLMPLLNYHFFVLKEKQMELINNNVGKPFFLLEQL